VSWRLRGVKIVSFFNHKGGVGKTTIVYNAAIALGELGHRVLLIDADAQANLTAVALPEERVETSLEQNATVWAALRPLVSGSGDIVEIEPTQIRDAIWLLPGDIRLSHFEAICPHGWTEALAGEARGYRVTAALYRLFVQLGASVEADLVFVDLGPNVNALNRTALLGSDGFVVPMAPDLFSIVALPSVGTSTEQWVRDWQTALVTKRVELDFVVPEGKPVPLGYVSQQFSVYRKEPSGAFKKWMDKIPNEYQTGVVDPLRAAGIEPPSGSPEIGSLPNFYSLVPIAQEANKAVFELSGAEARGAQYTRAQDTRETFAAIGREILRRVDGG
jgi:ATPases involved in chromosome partitioning